MSRCVGDRTLWLLSEGEANYEARAHVVSCAACTARLHRLEQDLNRLRSALADPPPSRAALPRGWTIRDRWQASVAALAAMVVVAWFAVWWQAPLPSRSTEVHQESIWPFIEGISTALFLGVEGGLAAPLERESDLDDLQAALVDGWLCEELEGFADGACDEDTFHPSFVSNE